MPDLPLAGRRVLVTRAAHQAGRLSDGLRALGAIAVEVPVLKIAPPASFAALDAALRKIDDYDWIILTSANTVKALRSRAAEIGASELKPDARVAAVGAATASAATEAGWKVDVVPDHYVAEGLVTALAGNIQGNRVLLARAAVARDVIPDALRAAGAIVDVVDAYRNEIPETAPERLRQAVADRLDAATFTSSSSVTHLAEVAKAGDVRFPFAAVAAVSIGPVTSQTLRELGWEPAAEADPHDIPGLIACVARVLA
ncbi:MAG TPA: uroporphyrinogen-III synthase [Terracidiphilus sp.]|jgi:uroporphyrinogen-III synthase/uroporphyrinogen III methyltransferase/synthase